jgi:hypothetical protein
MPRRLPVRPAKIIGNMFVLLVVVVMGLIYYANVFLIWGPQAVQNSDSNKFKCKPHLPYLLQTTSRFLRCSPFSTFSLLCLSGHLSRQ